MQAVAQKAFAQRAPVARASGRAARNTRAVAVCASSEQARQVFSGVLAAGVASLVAANAAFANVASPIDVFDDRKARDTGFDLIYEARDLDLPQSSRDGLDQFRGNLDATKQRVKDAEARIDSLLEPSIKKAYWTEAREELRRQVGTLRFDLNTLAETKAKGEKKAAQSLKKEFIAKVEALDFALRQKDQASATKALEATKGALDSVLAAVL